MTTDDQHLRQLTQFAVECSADAAFFFTPGGRFFYVNQAACELLGYHREELLALSVAEIDAWYRDEHMREVFARVEAEGTATFESRHRHKDGRELPVEISVNALEFEGERFHVAFVRDITRRKRSEEALRRSEDRFRSLVQNASDMVSILDAQGRVTYESPAHERLLGYRPEERLGGSVFELVHPDDRERVLDALHQAVDNPSIPFSVEYRFHHRDGTWRVLESTGTNLLADPAVEGIVVNSRDVTDRRETEEQLRHQALHDALTGLPNRALFADRLESALARHERHPERQLAVLFVDLDRFKVVNDSLGHAVGDRLLVEIAGLLRRCLKRTDTVARVGGDEFLVLLDELRSIEDAPRVATRLQRSLEHPLQVEGHEIVRTASIGIAGVRHGESTVESLLRDADTAMYKAKARGGACHVVFDGEMHRTVLERLRLETDLRRALERRELSLVFQPIVHLENDTLAGLEALVRWRHPLRGTVLPEEFLEVAEETGMIRAIDDLVLGEVCRCLHRWRDLPGFGPGFFVSINLSPRSLAQPDAAERLLVAATHLGVEPSALAVEITEGSFLENPERIAATFGQMRERGVLLLLDDFGAGYSSLGHLRRLPFDALKIDRSFVADADGIGGTAEIIRAVVALGRNLGLQVIAEGVETADQAVEMRRLGCHAAQGLYFAAPLEAGEVVELLARIGRESGAPATPWSYG